MFITARIHAIKDVSFEVNEGEIVTLIGANGAGKSRLCKTVFRLRVMRTGSIEFAGRTSATRPQQEQLRRVWRRCRREGRIFYK